MQMTEAYPNNQIWLLNKLGLRTALPRLVKIEDLLNQSSLWL